MELFSKDICRAFQDQKGNFLDVSEWEGVECDKSGNVISIKWEGIKAFTVKFTRDKRHYLDFRWIPKTVENISIRRVGVEFFDTVHLPNAAKKVIIASNVATKVSGVFETESLPNHLEFIDMSTNVLEGKVDCTSLPQTIETFIIDRNKFSGSLCMAKLPKRVIAMLLHENKFSGDIDLSRLPESLRLLTLYDNNLRGNVWLDGFSTTVGMFNKGDRLRKHIPSSGRAVFILKNQFSGKLAFHDRGQPLGKICCASNCFTSVDWKSMERVENLDASINEISGTLDTGAIPSTMRFLNLARNAICGTLNMSKLLPTMISLDLSQNKISGTLNVFRTTPARVFLEGNQIHAVCFHTDVYMTFLKELILVNNKIQQEEFQLPLFGSQLERIDLRGNDIKRCLTRDGEIEESDRILYDGGTQRQRFPLKKGMN